MKYVKPTFDVMEFQLNDAVAYCAPETVTQDVSVKVDCTISGSHYIFYDACGNQNEGADYEDCAIVRYNGVEYLIWAKRDSMVPGVYEGGSGNSLSGQSLLEHLVSVYNNATDGTNFDWGNVHGGLITPEIESIRNQSA